MTTNRTGSSERTERAAHADRATRAGWGGLAVEQVARTKPPAGPEAGSQDTAATAPGRELEPPLGDQWCEPLGEPLAEAAVLGCLLQTTAAHARQVMARLTEQDWSVPQHAHVAQAIRVLLGRGVPVDPVTVLGQLRRQGLENAHTASRDAGVLLVELCQSAPTIASASHYSQIVLEHSYRRRVQTAALRLLRAAGHASLDALTDLIAAEHDAISDEQLRLAAAAPKPDGSRSGETNARSVCCTPPRRR